MRTITTQKQARQAQQLPFCYLCGATIPKRNSRTKSLNTYHVPPRELFAKGDRNWPLILTAHLDCNVNRCHDDEVAIHLLGVIHRADTLPLNQLPIRTSPLTLPGFGRKLLGLDRIHLESIVWRWIRGFHAALYNEFLPNEANHQLFLPFERLREQAGKIIRIDSDIQRRFLVSTVKGNRHAGKIDRLECCGGWCKYHCVWQDQLDGTWGCAFALQLYDWKNIGQQPLFHLKGCVGGYVLDHRPQDASICVPEALISTLPNQDPLDAFEN